MLGSNSCRAALIAAMTLDRASPIGMFFIRECAGERASGEVGGHPAGRDDLGGDAELREFEGQGLGEADHGELVA